MSSRRSPSGPKSMLTGIVVLAQTVINISTAAGGNVATATGILEQFVAPAGTARTRMDPRLLSTNDVVTASPRGTVPLSTSQVCYSFARVSSIGTASAVVELTFSNPNSAASATLVANTWNLSVQLQGGDF